MVSQLTPCCMLSRQMLAVRSSSLFQCYFSPKPALCPCLLLSLPLPPPFPAPLHLPPIAISGSFAQASISSCLAWP